MYSTADEWTSGLKQQTLVKISEKDKLAVLALSSDTDLRLKNKIIISKNCQGNTNHLLFLVAYLLFVGGATIHSM